MQQGMNRFYSGWGVLTSKRIKGYKPMLDREKGLPSYAKVCYGMEQALRIYGEPISFEHFQNMAKQGEWKQLAEELDRKLFEKCENIPFQMIPSRIEKGCLVLIITDTDIINVIGRKPEGEEEYEMSHPDYDRPVFLKLSSFPIAAAYALKD